VTERALTPHVLLLSGNMCDARLWAGGDGAIFKAIAGHGLTHRCVDFRDDSSITAMANRALELVAGPLIVIGFSMGGIVALEMARIAPDRLIGLGLIDTTSHADTRGPQRLRQQDDVRAGKLEQVVVQELKPNYLAPCHAGDTGLLTLLCDMAMQLGPGVFIAQSEALRTRADLTPTLGALTMPVLLACGAHDALCPPSVHHEMANLISQAHLHIVADAGHILSLEQPQAFAGLLSQFLTTTLGTRL
jgi:pimeloyl-ACP methyl ester carboxylesterase